MKTCTSCGREHLNDNPTCFDCSPASPYSGINIATNDQFRSFHLSSRKDSEQQRQQRAIGGPQDKFEAKRMERDLGRKYIGDDASYLRPAGQRAIERHKERVKNGEVRA